MNKLVCDVCGGSIVVLEGGEQGKCEYCGADYSLGRMREIVNGIKVSQTGSAEDVEQWRELVTNYINVGSFTDAELIVKKILEALPSDALAAKQYDELQIYKYCDIRNGVLIKYTGTLKELTIPSCVKELAPRAFSGHQYLERVILPETITEISSEAFSNCNLKSVLLPQSIVAIRSGAFSGCNNLQNIELPPTVKTIERSAFENCSTLLGITIPEGITCLESYTFGHCSRLHDVVLPSTLTEIGDGAFAYCSSLEKIFIPNKVKQIKDHAFQGCTALKSVALSKSLDPANLGSLAFMGCDSLENIVHSDKFTWRNFFGTKYCKKGQLSWDRQFRAETEERDRRLRAEREERDRQLQAEREERLRKGYCPYCNIPLSGIFTLRCRKCGKTF